MSIADIFETLDRIAPKELSDEYCRLYDAYDNSGVLVDTGKGADSALFSLDFSLGAVEAAAKAGAGLIVTHHPAIYGKIGSLRADDPLGAKLIGCVERGISVVSMHLNLDCAEGGIDDSLADALGGKRCAVMEPLSKGGYGKICEVEPCAAEKFAERVKSVFSSGRVRFYGTKEVRRVASFCGAGVSERAIAFALENGADTVVSSDWKHHLVALCLESGCNAVDLTHYASELIGFRNYYKKCQAALPIPCLWHEDPLA